MDLPDPNLPFVINCDASGYAVGAVLQQDKGDGLRPISFMSKKMNAAETRYPVHEQELLAIITALTLWRHHLEGTDTPVRIRTDHKSLIYFQTQPMLSGRQTRWVETLSRYNYVVEYIRGADNIVADALSRRVDHNDGSVPFEREPVFVDNKQTFELNTVLTVEDRSSLDELQLTATEMRRSTLRQAADRKRASDYAAKIFAQGELVLPPSKAGGERVTPTQRCVADNAKGEQCGAKTAKGRYCHNHMRLKEGLRVTKSTIAAAGLGLFAARDFKKGEHIADYTGDRLALRADSIGGAYVLQMTKREGIDAARTNAGYGRWVNDPRGSGREANTEFVVNTKTRSGRVRATRNIAKGTEIFVSYGADYWKVFGPQAKLPMQPAAIVENIETDETDESVITQFSSSFAEAFEKACNEDKEYNSLLNDRDSREMLSQAAAVTTGVKTKIRARAGRLWKNGRLWAPKNKAIRTRIIQECHDSPLGGHLGRDKTLELVSRYFIWGEMAKEVATYVTTCDQCQRNKSSQQKTAGELMPIPSPEKPAHTWTMDLITELPPSRNGNDAIAVWVCKFTKLRHYAACKTAIDAPSLARLFLSTIVRQHGLPKCIISDRDPRFTAHFWKAFWGALGTTLNMSTAFHPQTDGQTENANKTLEVMLRSRVDFDQEDWDEHLAAAELSINNAVNATTGYTPFYLFYGREATLPLDLAIAGLTAARQNPAAAEELARWHQALRFARDNTTKAQRRQAKYANKHRRVEEYQVDDKVLLSTAHLKLQGEAKRARKFTERYIGPYRVKRVVNKNAYELELPPQLRIHPVVNVSILKRYRDGSATFPDRPIEVTRPEPVAIEDSGSPVFEVERILEHRRQGRNKRVHYLVRWKGYPDHEATWEPIENLDGALDLVIDYNKRHKVDLGVMTVLQVMETASESATVGAYTASRWGKRPEALWK